MIKKTYRKTLKESSDLYDIQTILNDGHIKLIKIVEVRIEYFESLTTGNGKLVESTDLTKYFEKYYTNIHNLLEDIHVKTDFSPYIDDYRFNTHASDEITTTEMFNEDFEVSSNTGEDFYEGVLTVVIEILKYQPPTVADMKALGLQPLR